MRLPIPTYALSLVLSLSLWSELIKYEIVTTGNAVTDSVFRQPFRLALVFPREFGGGRKAEQQPLLSCALLPGSSSI